MNLGDDKCDKMVLRLLFMDQHNRHKQCKTFKKDISKELVPVAWCPT